MSDGAREAPSTRKANQLLRRARELRGWSRQRLVLELQQRFPGVAVTAKDIARWERGKRRPGPYYREKLCLIFELTAEQLGFIESSPAATTAEPYVSPLAFAQARATRSACSWDTVGFAPGQAGLRAGRSRYLARPQAGADRADDQHLAGPRSRL
ncbi:hypothetical protein A4R35_19315 [Thermogemmatispora tikiterensis]|uniref:HTH cro/C1-type domain-containing protein n=1 Tax=Thermogemmatispora tikiterensis TaxID=1825093 RepID=A0A328VJQ1_9CHLR|nr:hypothetical protein A4R35_19315 [Thermogemmatispora tikiterensis]